MRSNGRPQTRYAKSGDVSIAYQVVGDGPIDVVIVFGWISNIAHLWDPAEGDSSFVERLATFSRVIMFDKRGTGMSDPVDDPPSLELRMDDMRAVMDAVGSERAALFGMSEGGPMSMLFSATYPDRVTHLVVSGSAPRFTTADDYPFAPGPDQMSDVDHAIEHWGEGLTTKYFFPELAGDAATRAAVGRFETMGASPAMARKINQAARAIDVRDVLPVIQVPTLVHHRRGDAMLPVEGAVYMAERIPSAELFIQEGSVHPTWLGPSRELADRIELFLTGSAADVEPNRVLATVMFTDIVDSTKKAASSGDRAWRELLDSHDAVTSRHVDLFSGRLVKQTGDGALASFDRPAAAVRCAMAIRDELPEVGLDIRAGVHTGEVELRGNDLGGIGVHIGARVAGLADRGQVLVSRTVRDLVIGSGLQFVDIGSHTLKGVPDEWQIYEAAG